MNRHEILTNNISKRQKKKVMEKMGGTNFCHVRMKKKTSYKKKGAKAMVIVIWSQTIIEKKKHLYPGLCSRGIVH